MSNILPGTDRFCNLLTSYLPSNPSLPIFHSYISSNSMHLTKANRKIADNLDQMVGILDSRMPMETTRRNTLVALRVEGLNNSRKARKTRHPPVLLPTMMFSPYLLPLQSLQIVSILQIPLWIFWRTPERLHTSLLHLYLVLPPLGKLLTPSCSSSKWMLRSLLR